MKAFENRVYNYIIDNQLLDKEDKVLLGVSGGADSVCLLRVLCSLKEKLGISDIVAVHINHMIRGAEADSDEEFTRSLCEGMKVKFFAFKEDILGMAKQLGITTEEAGRQYRYEKFEETAKLESCNKIAVAHHMNDDAETIIFNMIRGSGVSGVAGISAKRGKLVRPLLDVSRIEIESYLEEINQSFVTDSTNETLDYTRNRVRNVIVPAMEEINDAAVRHISILGADAKLIDDYLNQQAKIAYEQAVEESDSREGNEKLVFDVNKLMDIDEIILIRVIHNAIAEVAGKRKDITRNHINAVSELIKQSTGKNLNLPYDIIARTSYGKLIIQKKMISDIDGMQHKDSEVEIIDIDELKSNFKKEIVLQKGKLIIEYMTDVHELRLGKNVYTKIIDCDKIKGNVCIRKPQDGDYIVITEDGHTKSMNRVFIDAKIDREERKNWPVIAIDNEIIWAIGLRYNEAYRIDQNTKSVISFTFLE